MTWSEAMTNLESSADTEDTVVGLLRGKTLESSLNGQVLLGDQVIESNIPVSLILHSTCVLAVPDKRERQGSQLTQRHNQQS